MSTQWQRAILCFVLQVPILFALAQAQQPKEIPAAPVPSQILAAKRLFISNAGGEGADPRALGFLDVDLNRPYNQFYAAIKNSGKYELVSTPVDADLILEIRFTHSLIVEDMYRPRYTPVLKLRILDTKTGALLWAFTEGVRTPGGPHYKEKRESAFDQALNALFDDFTKLASPRAN